MSILAAIIIYAVTIVGLLGMAMYFSREDD